MMMWLMFIMFVLMASVPIFYFVGFKTDYIGGFYRDFIDD